jgi:acyl CoA:acetate/3-ketoacid CoA transferase beta subunit
VVTELGVFRFIDGVLTLEEIAPEIDLTRLAELTEARFVTAAGIKVMDS